MTVKHIFTVTGGLGFIGKNFVQACLKNGHFVINIDIMNYAADQTAAKELLQHPNYKFIHEDITQLSYLSECDYLVNFAAESHVDNSIADSDQFCQTNIGGTHRLLELVRAKSPDDRPRFVQISTDEVYGDVAVGAHDEGQLLKPSNPYSSTKAAADMLVLGWARTYNIRYNIIRMTNNYGVHQYPEKLIPKSISRMRRGKPAIVHGSGEYIRCWLHVDDSVNAIFTILDKGSENEIYNVGGNVELKNIEVINKIAQIIGVEEKDAYVFVGDRVGQDVRYDLDSSNLENLSWKPLKQFDKELIKIINAHSFERFS